MVGVPGKSRGCNTCRKRKKGCDQARPSCGQCIKSGIECSGYERHRTFVNASQPGGEKLALTVTRISPLAAVPTLQHGLSRSAHELRYLGLFWDMYLPRGEVLSDAYLRYSVGSWTSIARENHKSDPALYRAVLAMSLTSLGHQRGDQSMREEGLKQYVKALGEMKSGLRHPRRQRSDGLLIASRMLGLYEMLYGNDQKTQAVTQANSWQGHNLGEMALISLRTPESHTENPAHALFCDGRMSLIIASINLRKRCFLSEPRWKTVPWSKIPKTPKDVLWDSMADIPSLLEAIDVLQTLPYGPQKAELYHRLIKECWRLDGELNEWFKTMCPHDHFEKLEKRGFDFKEPSPEDQATVGVMVNYWTGCLIVYSNLRSLLSAYPPFAATISSMAPSTDPMFYCSRIGDVLSIFVQPSSGRFGWHLAPFPAGIASGYLLLTGQITSPEMMKLVCFFGREDGGRHVALFLKSMLESGYGKWPVKMDDGSYAGPDVKSLVLRTMSSPPSPPT